MFVKLLNNQNSPVTRDFVSQLSKRLISGMTVRKCGVVCGLDCAV
jgi:hypothetical protein